MPLKGKGYFLWQIPKCDGGDAARIAARAKAAGLTSYRYPQLHYQLPYAQFLERCDFAMPQVYFEFSHNPEDQLERTVAQYQALRPARPIFVTGPTYSHTAWRPAPAEV